MKEIEYPHRRQHKRVHDQFRDTIASIESIPIGERRRGWVCVSYASVTTTRTHRSASL